MKAVAAVRKKPDPLARLDLTETDSALRTGPGQLNTGRVELDWKLADSSSAGGSAGEDDGDRGARAAGEAEDTADNCVETESADEGCEKDG